MVVTLIGPFPTQPRFNRWTVGRAVQCAFVALLLAGCAPAATSQPQPPQPPPDPCAGVSPPSPLTWDDLRAALGKPVSSVEGRALVARWGEGRPGRDWQGRQVLFDEAVVLLGRRGMPDEEVIQSILVHPPKPPRPAYSWQPAPQPPPRCHDTVDGGLPHGLAFGDDVSTAVQQVGPKPREHCEKAGMCRYHAQGLELAFDRQKLSGVAVIAPIADDEYRVRWLTVQPDQREHGVLGLRVSLRGADARNNLFGVRTAAALQQVVDGASVPLRAIRQARAYRNEQGELRAGRSTHQHSLFFPYWALELEPGTHEVTVVALATRREVRGFSARGPEVPLRTVGNARYTLTVTIPERETVRASVRRVVVDKAVYDDTETGSMVAGVATGGATFLITSFFPERWKRADPQWCVGLGLQRIYCSIHRKDIERGAWNGYTPPIRLSRGDKLNVVVRDNDGGRGVASTGDTIASFDLTTDEWRRQVKSRKPLSRKHLQQMWLAPLR